MRVDGRVAVVTGAARGIGLAIADALGRAGARVVRFDRDELALGGAVDTRVVDVTDGDAFAAAIADVERSVGPVDVLVNNAGIMVLGGFLDLSPAADRRQVDVNVYGVLNGMRAVLPGMIARGRGCVVNVASSAGRAAIPHASTYSGTKAAVIALTDGVRYEVAARGVVMVCVMPALVDTELIAGAKRPLWPPVARPEDVARAVVDAIARERPHVYVPRAAKLGYVLPAVLPAGLVERVGRFLRFDQMFAGHDAGAREAYARRTS